MEVDELVKVLLGLEAHVVKVLLSGEKLVKVNDGLEYRVRCDSHV